MVTRNFILCETLNVMITDKALEAMGAKKVTLVVLLELSKAFNSIDHVTLLAKLQALGASRASLDWFKSYLSEWLQCVRIGAETSSLQGISHGVPQGSILGPAFFLLYQTCVLWNHMLMIPSYTFRFQLLRLVI